MHTLFQRNFVLLWQGQFISALGTAILQVAMLFWLLETTGSATTMGLILMASALPGVLFSLFAGVLVDRVNRKRLIITCDVILGTSILSLVIPFTLYPEHTNLALGWFFFVLTMNGLVMAVFRPTIVAITPDLVSPGRLDAANSAIGGSQAIVQIIGQGLGGVLFLTLGPAALVLLNGITFTLSAVSEAFIRLPPKSHLVGAHQTGSALTDIKEGLSQVATNRGLLQFLILASFLNFLVMPLTIVLPFIVRDQLGLDADWFGFSLASLGFGSVVGFALFSSFHMDGQRRYFAVFVSQCVIGACLFLLPWASTASFLCLAMFAIGAALPPANVSLLSLIQATTPEPLRGRVSSVATLVTGAIVPLSLGVSGILFDATGQDIGTFERATGILYVAVAIVFLISPSVRSFLCMPVRIENAE